MHLAKAKNNLKKTDEIVKEKKMVKKNNLLNNNSIGMTAYLPVLIVVLIFLFAYIEPRFFTLQNFINLSRQSSFLAILACGQILVVLTTGVDLSLGTLIALVSVVSSIVAKQYGIILGMSCGLMTGIIIGLINGIAVSIFNAQSFAVTLGAMTYSHGLALVFSNGRTIVGLPQNYRIIGTGYIVGIPIPTIIAILVIIITYFILHKTKYGRYIYAVGGNIEAARLAGINVKNVLIGVYILCSFFAAIAGVVMSSRINSGQPNIGVNLGLECVAAVILGGVTWRGGEGKLIGVVFGVILLGILSNGFDLIGVTSFMKMVITGLIILIAVCIDSYSRKAVS